MEGNQGAVSGKRGGYGVQLDVSDEEAVKEMVEGVVKKFGRLDIIYNNAGMHAERRMQRIRT